MVACSTYPERFIRDNVVALFLLYFLLSWPLSQLYSDRHCTVLRKSWAPKRIIRTTYLRNWSVSIAVYTVSSVLKMTFAHFITDFVHIYNPFVWNRIAFNTVCVFQRLILNTFIKPCCKLIRLYSKHMPETITVHFTCTCISRLIANKWPTFGIISAGLLYIISNERLITETTQRLYISHECTYYK